MKLPDERRFPCKPERLESFITDALALLGADGAANPELVMSLNHLPQTFAHNVGILEGEPDSKEEKRKARSIRTHSVALAKLLGDAPERVKNHLGFWLGGMALHRPGESESYEPDPRWQARNPKAIDTAGLYIAALGVFAGSFADAKSPKPDRSAQENLIHRAIELAERCEKSKEVGLEIAKLAYRAVFAHDPKGDDWGEYHGNRKREG